jgi:17beta-estradiol 17-dehydrogenase / very-long-chain 3-oxoacyl-CoA reductase
LWAFRFSCVFCRHFFGTHASTERYGEESWAVITGSTDGIGKASAMHLARLGFNIVLIARNVEKLQDVAKQI